MNNSVNDVQITTVKGGCHCQAVQFEATVIGKSVILDCNCSICSMTGFKHLIVEHENFKLICGKDFLNSYQFNTKKANHLFCSQCGVKSFYQPRSHPDCWSLNINCIDNFDPSSWQHEQFDGKNWEQAKSTLD